jgi:hypothetical protein
MDVQDVIQTFADGETVDPEALDRALADPEGRRHLIDILVLRGFMHTDAAIPSAPVVRRPLRWLSIAAAIALVATLGGYLAGERTATNRLAAPPAVVPAAPIDAPEPTQVITFKPGVDWNEHKGGF